MELECTRCGAGSRDHFIRVENDDGEAVVTKSSCSASVVCGRLGDGKALPVYIVYASGNNYEVSWAPEITNPDILDKDGKPLQWRYHFEGERQRGVLRGLYRVRFEARSRIPSPP